MIANETEREWAECAGMLAMDVLEDARLITDQQRLEHVRVHGHFVVRPGPLVGVQGFKRGTSAHVCVIAGAWRDVYDVLLGMAAEDVKRAHSVFAPSGYTDAELN